MRNWNVCPLADQEVLWGKELCICCLVHATTKIVAVFTARQGGIAKAKPVFANHQYK